MNTPATSLSGNVHGMPLAALLGPEPAELSKIGTFSPKVLPAHTVLVGIRNLDEREKIAVRDSGVHVFTMKDIDRQGIASIVEQAVNLAGNGTAGVHASFDMDVCDPLIAPGVSHLEAGRMPVHRVDTDLSVLAHEVVSAARVVQPACDLAVETYGDSMCKCAPELTRRIIENLVSTAVRVTPVDGRVRVIIA